MEVLEKKKDVEELLSMFKVSGVAIASAFHYYYLKFFKKNNLSSGNKDFFLGLRDDDNYNSFSLPEIKKTIKKLV